MIHGSSLVGREVTKTCASGAPSSPAAAAAAAAAAAVAAAPAAAGVMASGQAIKDCVRALDRLLAAGQLPQRHAAADDVLEQANLMMVQEQPSKATLKKLVVEQQVCEDIDHK